MPKRNGKRPLVREDEPSQKTKTGLEIPVPKTEDFERMLRKAATRKPRTSKRVGGTRRTAEP